MSRRQKFVPHTKTGRQPVLMQDDDSKLSKWLAGRIDAREVVRRVCAEIRTDGCGRSVPTPEAASQAAWTCLQITGRYRCLACVRALNEVNKPKETDD